MELKYYLRGLGLGIVMTAIIMGAVTARHRTMTNEEIIARAKQLGMTEDAPLTDINSGKTDDDAGAGNDAKDNADGADAKITDASKSDGSVPDDDAGAGNDVKGSADEADSKPAANMTDVGTDAEAGEMDEANPEEQPKESPEEQPQESPGEGNGISDAPVVITVGHGDGSYSVSKKLADVKAVSSAGSFDTFLCENGYDKKIRAGTYTIPSDASDEQIARIITGLE